MINGVLAESISNAEKKKMTGSHREYLFHIDSEKSQATTSGAAIRRIAPVVCSVVNVRRVLPCLKSSFSLSNIFGFDSTLFIDIVGRVSYITPISSRKMVLERHTLTNSSDAYANHEEFGKKFRKIRKMT